MSDTEEFFESVAMLLSVRGDTSDRVFPVREFFGHIIEAKQFVDALMSAGKFNDNMELARGLFARGIERRLAELAKGQGISENERPAIAFAHAGALLALLTWWIDRGMREAPAEMDELFHRIVWNGAS